MAASAHRPAWLPLGSLLIREGLINSEQLELALMEQHDAGGRLGEILVRWGWVTSGAIARALAEQYELDFVDLAEEGIDDGTAVLLREKLARRYDALPVRTLADGLVLVAIADPTNVSACEEIRLALRRDIRLAVADGTELRDALDRVHGVSTLAG
jgi:type IV pilus assembly protein PilB